MSDHYRESDAVKGEPVRPQGSQEERMRRIRKMWGIEWDDEGETRDKGASSSKEGVIIEDTEEQEEEGGRPKYKRVEPRPSQREVDEHMLTHIPFRSWCPHCVRGKSKAAAHRKHDMSDQDIPVISVDYMYMEPPKEDKELGMPILVMKDRRTGWIQSSVVPRKGKCAHAIKEVCRGLDTLGYKQVVLKSDQEPAIMELKACVKRERGEDTIMEESPGYDSKSNGEIERAIQTVQGQVRTMKVALEDRTRQRIQADHVILPWIVQHAAAVINRYHKGSDGATPYRRARGREFNGDMCEMGERIWYMKPGMTGKEKLESKWEDGIWVGVTDTSGEKIIATPQGCLKVRSVKRRPEEERWDIAALQDIKGVPWEVIPGHPDREIKCRIFIEAPPGEPERMPQGKESTTKRVYITKKDIAKHGVTEGCEGCRAVIRGGETRPHSEECRKRIEKAMAEEGNERWKRADERIQERIVEEMEKQLEEKRRAEEREKERIKKEEKDKEDQDAGQDTREEEDGRKRKDREIHEGEEEQQGVRRRMSEEESRRNKRKMEDGDTMESEDRRQKRGGSMHGGSSSSGSGNSSRKRAAEDMPPDEEQPRKWQPPAEEDIEKWICDQPGDTFETDDEMGRDASCIFQKRDDKEAPDRIEGNMSRRWNIKRGIIMDLGTRDESGEQWNFDSRDKRNRIREYITNRKPLLVIGSHVQAVVSSIEVERLQDMSQDTAQDIIARNLEHQEFLADMYRIQAEQGRYFMHEIVEGAASGTSRGITRLRRGEEIGTARIGSWQHEGGEEKGVNMITNARDIARCLDRVHGIIEHRYEHGDEEQDRYGREGEKAIIAGLLRTMRRDGRIDDTFASECVMSVEDNSANQGYVEELWDNLSGEWLEGDMVREARKEEMEEFKKHEVYIKVPMQECYERTGAAPIGTRWVDINKGDKIHPEYRSRLVAQEINVDKREDLFAATPPLEAKKILMSLAVTEGVGYRKGGKDKGMKLDFIDVRRAYFHARARREVYVKLPAEDSEEGMCGKLNKAMYGTRDAAQNWEYAYIEWLESIAFRRGRASPCVFYHEDKGIRLVVHGDDFTVLGYEESLDWFRRCINEKFEVKFRGRLGPEDTDDKCIRILNRVVTWTDNGIEYEADQRHSDIIISKLGYGKETNGVVTPGEKSDNQDIRREGDEDEMNKEDAKMYRALVARANYLAQDRTDIAFAVKELCRNMSSPRQGDWKALKRLGRYLVGKPRIVTKFNYQDKLSRINVWVDSDHAGCKRTRKSTSGGIVMLGNHPVKGWSITQGVIALSSGESEFYGIVKGSSVGLGIKSILGDLGVKVRLRVYTDSSAAKGIASRRGLGKVRHIEVNQLWIQEKVADGTVELQKTPGIYNLADTLTKHVGRDILENHLNDTFQYAASGRHPIMPGI